MDTIGEFLTRIRNAQSAKHEKVDIPASKVRENLARVLKEQKYIADYKVVKDSKQGMMRVYLNYDQKGKPSILKIVRKSKPSRRYYVRKDEIPNVREGYGMAIVSTSKGIMSGGQAREKNLGGELLCVVW